MDASDPQPPRVEYYCPGQRHPISRAVHLGRLAAFFPLCRQCSHRNDVGTLSTRQIEQLAETDRRGNDQPLFNEEGVAGIYLNDLTPAAARDIAAAFGTTLREEQNEIRQQDHNPAVLVAGDGRAIASDVTAAMAEGLRFTSCDVLDAGEATAACLAHGIAHFQASAGILASSPGDRPHVVQLQFWSAGPRPLSKGKTLESIERHFRVGVARTTRNYGSLARRRADEAYLAALSQYYHALRPLRFVLDSASKPAAGYLQKLTAKVACEIIAHPAGRREGTVPIFVAAKMGLSPLPADLADEIRRQKAHFAVWIDGDGEKCLAWDERGCAVPPERLLSALAKQMHSEIDRPEPTIVLEPTSSKTLAAQIEKIGYRTVIGGPHRAEMAAAMADHDAILGGGPSGRLWHRIAGLPLPDAVTTVTRLLILLSQSDEPFSAVLDRQAPIV